MSNNVVRLPMPPQFRPKATSVALSTNVRTHFATLYNAKDSTFRDLLASVGNKDAIHGNRLFDRHDAVRMIKALAKDKGDTVVSEAVDGLVYKAVVGIMRTNNMGLKLRRREYLLLTQQAAE